MRTGLLQMRRASLLLSPWTPQCTFTVAPPRIVAVQVIHPRWWGGVECYRNRGRHAKKRERQKLVHGAWRVRSDGMRGGVQNIMPSLFSCIQVSLPVADFQIFDMLRYASICFDISRLFKNTAAMLARVVLQGCISTEFSASATDSKWSTGCRSAAGRSDSRRSASRRPPARILGLGIRVLCDVDFGLGRCRHGSSDSALAWPPAACFLSSKASTLVTVNMCIGVMNVSSRPRIRRPQQMKCMERKGTSGWTLISSPKRR